MALASCVYLGVVWALVPPPLGHLPPKPDGEFLLPKAGEGLPGGLLSGLNGSFRRLCQALARRELLGSPLCVSFRDWIHTNLDSLR